MKKQIIAAILFGAALANNVNAQQTAYNFLNKVPAFPASLCGMNKETFDNFRAGITQLQKEIDASLSKQNYQELDAQTDEMTATQLKKAGLSQNDVNKMQNSTTAQNAYANKVSTNVAGISIEDAKAMENMSDAELEAWGKQYAAKQNPKTAKVSAKEVAAQKNKVNTLAEIQQLTSKLRALEADLGTKSRALQSAIGAENKRLEPELKPLIDKYRQINDGEGATKADLERKKKAKQAIQAKMDESCAVLMPKAISFTQEVKEKIKAALPDYERLEKLQNESNQSQLGIKTDIQRKGTATLAAVSMYVGFFESALNIKSFFED